MAIDLMEPIDFDTLIREKVLEEGNIHSKEANMARSGIWIGVQDKLKKGRFISWYHLAASIVFLIIGFSVILFIVQKNYHSENRDLLVKIEKLEKLEIEYRARMSSLEVKEKQIQTLTSNLNSLESKIAGLSEQKLEAPVPVVKTIYQTDTIFVKTVEYLTQVPESEIGSTVDQNVLNEEVISDLLEKDQVIVSTQIDDKIYPSPTTKNQDESTEKVKFKFGNFIARKN